MLGSTTPVGGQASPPLTHLGEHLLAARLRAFVGRAGELALLRSALDGAADSFRVIFLTGPCGIGKSTLLRRFADEARAAGRTVLEIDGREGEPTAESFEARAAGVLHDDRGVLLVDSFEAYEPLEGRLRDRVLPGMPLGSLVVIAGRRPPSEAWRADPGWDEVLRVVSLPDLSREEAVALLEARGVPAERHEAVLAFAGGLPLALSLAADTARQDGGTGTATGTRGAPWAPTQEMIGTLATRLVGEVPSPAHRRALEICAHVDTTAEGLLRAALPEADAEKLFAWLRGLPFMRTGPHGLFPHEVVRGVLDADLRWRDPQRYRNMHRWILGHFIERMRQARGDVGNGTRVLAASLLYLQRNGFGTNWYAGPRRHEVVEDTFRPDDREAVLRLAEAEGGPESAAVARHWLDRQPETFHLYRHARTGELLGFMAWLRLTAPDEGDLAADPVVAEAWRSLRRTAPLRDGECLALARFMVSRTRGPSPELDLMTARQLADVCAEERLAWSGIVLENAERYLCFPYFAEADPPIPVRIGDREYGLFVQDWRTMPFDVWLERVDLMKFSEDGQEPPPSAGALRIPRFTVLSRDEFDAAVRSALRSWHRRDALSANPLVGTRLVAGTAKADAVAILRTTLREAVEALRTDRQGAKLHRAVVATYMDDAPTQQAAAERLGVPFSSYRRHLTQGVARTCELLWDRERRGDRPAAAGGGAPGQTPRGTRPAEGDRAGGAASARPPHRPGGVDSPLRPLGERTLLSVRPPGPKAGFPLGRWAPPGC
ncbi:ATP-binding protein [Streptomyces griseoaurantiacus]|uniref:ATP-binding protein n=1 Tax=Streptomyces griseoaurantiacus TaxID=68213 RepID=UPI003460FB37